MRFLPGVNAGASSQETGDNNPDRLLPLIGSAVCFGLAFNTKMLQGYIALPAVFAVYVFASRLGRRKKAVNLVLAAVALAVSSFWWAAAVSLVPASERPYIGGSTDGTAWNLIMGYNGLGRIFGGEGNGGGGGGGGGGGFSGTAGLGRLFNDILGGQISWLIPFATIACVGGLVLCGRAPRTDPVRAALVMWGGWTALHYLTFAMAEGTMHPYYTTALAPGIAALCGGGGALLLRAFRADRRWAWVLPAALAVTAVWAAVLLRRASGWNTWLWPTIAVVMALAIAGLLVFRSGTRVRLLAASVVAAIVAAVAGPAAYAWSVPSGSGGAGGMGGGTNPTAGPSTGSGFGGGEMPGGARQGGQAGGQNGGQTGQEGGAPGDGQMMPGGGDGELPGAPSGAGQAPGGAGETGGTPPGATGENGGTAAEGGTGGQPGGMNGGGGMGGMGGGASGELVSYLKKHQDGAKWLLAVSSSQSAAQLILSSGEPVISMWGWSGSDNAMTLATLKDLVKKGELHYVQVGGSGMGGGPGGGSDLSSEVTEWVRKNGTAVKESAYSSGSTSESSSSSQSTTSSQSNQSTVYRLDASDVG